MKLLLEKREKDYDKDKYGEIEEKDGLVEKRPKKEKKGGMGRGTGTGWEGKLGTDREIDMSKYKEDKSRKMRNRCDNFTMRLLLIYCLSNQ